MTSATAAKTTAGTDGTAPRYSRDVLRSFLHDRSPTSNERWRRWCTGLIRDAHLSAPDLLDWWTEVVEFDPVLRRHVTRPIAVPDDTVVVAGSGKEQFKTFNVSTAAAILAAAAGTPVVKGVSRSVSAISGAADILDVLRIRPVADLASIPDAMRKTNIAFVSYPLFCPRYAARYDGVFDTINPASFYAGGDAVRAGIPLSCPASPTPTWNCQHAPFRASGPTSPPGRSSRPTSPTARPWTSTAASATRTSHASPPDC